MARAERRECRLTCAYDGGAEDPALTVRMDRFLAANGPDALVVWALDGPPPRAFDAQVRRWRECVPMSEHDRMWSEAYEEVAGWIADAGEPLGAFLRLLRHHCADLLLRERLLVRLAREHVGPMLLVVPAEQHGMMRAAALAPARALEPADWLRPLAARARVLARRLGRLAQRFGPVREAGSPAHDAPAVDASRAPPSPDAPCVPIVVEDTVSGVNNEPALRIAAVLAAHGARAVLVTSAGRLAETARARGLDAATWRMPRTPLALLGAAREVLAVRGALRRAARAAAGPDARLALRALAGRAATGVVLRRAVHAVLDTLAAEPGELRALLAVNESSPLSVAAIEWARSRGVASAGYWPALVGDRPDYRDFPADVHLVYGEQMSDHLHDVGIAGDAVDVVGSVTFDTGLELDRERSRLAVHDGILRRWDRDERLVVVGTEALPDPLDEIEPVLRALLRLEGVHVAVKVHPADPEPAYQDLAARLDPGGGRIEVVGACDVHALVHAADLLVCVVSNIIVSAAVLGTPTLVCDFGDKRRALDFVAEGLCEGCTRPEETGARISALLFDTAERSAAIGRMRERLGRFNGPCDGRAHERVAARLMDLAAGSRAFRRPFAERTASAPAPQSERPSCA